MHLSASDAKIYVAGHRSMAGRAIWQHLEEHGYTNLVGRTSGELDLRDPHAARQFFEAEQPDFVVLRRRASAAFWPTTVTRRTTSGTTWRSSRVSSGPPTRPASTD